MQEVEIHVEREALEVANKWFESLKSGAADSALECLDVNVLWTNNPPDRGLSDIIPWLGVFHGRAEVQKSFVVWAELSIVKQFELRNLFVAGNEVMAVVYEKAEIKATGLVYDIEFIQRLKVSNGKIIEWKSYWDTVKGIVAFRGDLASRLLIAAKSGIVSQMELLLPYGADPNTVDEDSGQTALMIASGRGHLSAVQRLLEFGANPNILDSKAGAGALHRACQGGHREVVERLVQGGALIDLQASTTGHTPLVEAIWFTSDAIVDFLLSRNARIELLTYYGFSIDQHIEYALKVNKNTDAIRRLERIKYLIQKRRETDKAKCDANVLIQCVLNNDVNSVRAELKNGRFTEETHPIVGGFNDGHTPLLVAARDGNIELVRLLVTHGANVNATEPVFGAVPLHKATYNGHEEITKILAQAKNVDINYQGPSNGYTPLHDALWHGYDHVADVLIDAGARVDLIAYDGKLPLDIAVEQFGKDHAIAKKLSSKLTPQLD